MLNTRALILTAAGLASFTATSVCSQDASSLPVERQIAVTVGQLDQRMVANRHLLDALLAESLQALNELMQNPLQNVDFSANLQESASGLAQKMSDISDAQTNAIEYYASSLMMRSDDLFALWGENREQKSKYFMQTGSLYDLPNAEPEIDPSDAPVISYPSHVFVGSVPESGFFSMVQPE
ncbi:MAG: hypothetical protein DCO95_18805 [Roseivirga sp. XM-24bin3]|jgi:hypothetical protein|nr:MAG: hypothetical protein DCO95_18805 [Roseivirga sp. XM-24bin3]